MMDWLISNKEWLFSGAGIAIITVIGGLFLRRKKEASNYQSQRKKGKGQSIQAGGNVSITHNHGDSQKRDEMLKIASLEEIQKYDPRIRQLHENINNNINKAGRDIICKPPPPYTNRRLKWVLILLFIIASCVGVYLWLN